MREPDRYEPLPGIAELPAWLWGKASRGMRIALALTLLALLVGGAAAIPELVESGRERADAQRRQRAQVRAERVRELQAVQRPRRARSRAVAQSGADARRRLVAREGLMRDVVATLLADARRRVRAGALEGPIRRVECGPFPRTAHPAHADLARRGGRYACMAVTAESAAGSVFGHPYRARVDFRTGRYVYCKIVGAPGPEADPLVRVPRACGGS